MPRRIEKGRRRRSRVPANYSGLLRSLRASRGRVVVGTNATGAAGRIGSTGAPPGPGPRRNPFRRQTAPRYA